MNIPYFFRVMEDGVAPNIPLVFMIALIVGLFLLIRYVDRPKLYGLFGLSLQLVMLAWYWKAETLIQDGLPLYHCRIIIWIIGFGLLLNIQSKLITWASILGIAFALPVLLIRDMNPYKFPHITGFYYILGHSAIFLMAVSYLRHYYVKVGSAEIISYTMGLHLFIQLINLLLGSNYAYLRVLPLIDDSGINHYAFYIMSVVVIGVGLTINQMINRYRKQQESSLHTWQLLPQK